MKYRYYLKEGDEVRTVDCDSFPKLPEEFRKKDRPNLTLAMLAAGFKKEMFERAKNFLIDQGFLIRVPVFTNDAGEESEGQNDEYLLRERGNGYFYGMRPSQSAEILHDAIKDGFDISTSGGSGFSQNNRFFFDGIERNPQDFTGKLKPRIFAFSNISNSTILQDVFDYVHSVPLTLLPGAFTIGSAVEARQQAEQTLAIMKGGPVELKRQAVPINESARDLLEKAEIYDFKIRSYPLNIGTFFHNQHNSDFAFIPPEEDYSLILEGIIDHKIEKTPEILSSVRRFLQAMQLRGQKLPLMIEMGDCTPEEMLYSCDYVDGRVALKPEQARDLIQKEYYDLQKDQHDRSRAYDVEVQKICEEFGIAFFVGGETRIGHAKNQVQPSNSICRVKRDGYSLNIESNVRPRTLTTHEDVERIAVRGELAKLVIRDEIEDKTDCIINFELEQVNEGCKEDIDLSKIKSMNFSSTSKSDLNFIEGDGAKCFVAPKKGLVSFFTKALESALLSGEIYSNKTPLVIALSGGSEEFLIKAKKMIQAFCTEHKVTKPICLVKNFPDLESSDPDLTSIKDGKIAKYQTQVTMFRDEDKVPASDVRGGSEALAVVTDSQKTQTAP